MESMNIAGLAAVCTLNKGRMETDSNILSIYFKVHQNIFLKCSPQSGIVNPYVQYFIFNVLSR